MYKLVAIDLDGTLLNSYGEISEKNKEAIQKAKSKGAEIVIASGRPISSARSYAYEVGADNYIICGNGSVLYDMKNEQIIYDKFIERQKALQIIKICEENSIFFNIYTEKLTISKSLNYNILFYNNENKNVPEDKKTNIKIIDNIYKYVEENPDLQVLKITVCDESKIIFDSIIRKLREVKNVDVLDLQHMARKYIKLGTEEKKVEYYYTEITSKDVDKWGAIEELADRLQINKEEIMAIGDNMNDKRAKDIMTTDVIVANKNDIIANVANLLIKEKIGGLPVVDEENKVVGIISETDIMKKESHVDSPRMLNFIQGIIFLDDMKKFEDEMRAIAAYKVEDLMSKDIITVNENDTFDYVANVMINKSINRVPVVDENNFLKGIICRYDIIKAMYN